MFDLWPIVDFKNTRNGVTCEQIWINDKTTLYIIQALRERQPGDKIHIKFDVFRSKNQPKEKKITIFKEASMKQPEILEKKKWVKSLKEKIICKFKQWMRKAHSMFNKEQKMKELD